MSKQRNAGRKGKSVEFAEALEGRRLFANNYAVGNNPNDVVSADFNADGKPDLAVANTGGSTVSVLLGKRDGTFNAATSVAVGNAPKSIITSDFNNDGRADLVTANGSGGTGGYSVLLGNGNGTFNVTTTALTFEPFRQVVAADFTGNGVPDLAFSSGAAGANIVILQGAGNGTFASPITAFTGLSQAATFGVGDVDADGDADIVVANDLPSGALSVMKSNNNGIFVNSGFAAGNQPRNVVVRDVNADGRGDILFTVTGSPAVSVYLPQANGSLVIAAGVAFNQPFLFKVTDVNGDAKPDVISDSGQVALGNGNGTFGTVFQGVPGITFANSFNETIADVNADGRPDFVGVELGTPGNLTVRMGLSNGQFVDNVLAAPTTFTGPARADESVSDDFDNDGILDVAILNDAASGSVLVYKGSGTGTFTLINTRTVGSTPVGLSAGDFNNDGFIDLATANNGGAGSSSVLLNNGDGTFAPALSLAAGAPPSDVAVGDFNGDGKLDLAVSLEGTNNVRRWLGNGDGTFGTATDTAVGGNGPIDLAVADVNNDGRADLATANNSTSGGSTSVLLGTTAGGFTVLSGVILGGSARAVAFGDFGGDGNLDLAVGTDGDGGRYHILIGNGTGGFAFSAAQAEVGTTPTKLAAGDFNNDGRTDLVSGDGDHVRLLLGNGSGAIASLPPIAATNSAFTVTPGDYNGDGKLDVISSQFSGSTVNVLLNQTPSPLSPLAAVSGGVLTVAAGGTYTFSETRGQITLTKAGVTQYFSASAVGSIVANSTQIEFNSDVGRSGGMRNVALTLTGSANSTSTSFVSQHLTTLTLQDTSDLLIRGSFRLLRVTGLSIAADAQLDLGRSDLLYDYSGSTPLPTVRNLLVAGRGNGTWNGFQGIFSFNAFQNVAQNTTLGYMEATDYKSIYGATATFNAEGIDNTAVLIHYTLYGDTDFDNGVSINDFNRLSSNFGATGKLWINGDFDYDNGVSINDFNLLSTNFGKTLPLPAPTPRAGVAPTKVSPTKAPLPKATLVKTLSLKTVQTKSASVKVVKR